MRVLAVLSALVLLASSSGCSATESGGGTDNPGSETSSSAAYRYVAVADYLNDHGVSFEINSAATDDALGRICSAVDRGHMDPAFRRHVLEGLAGTPDPARTLATTIRGCYATGIAERPRLRVAYTTTCTGEYPQVFVTGDGTELTRTGYRFIADVTLHNEGNVPAVAVVRVTWQLVGGGNVSLTRIADRLAPGRRVKLGFSKPATLDQIQRMGAHGAGDRLCTVRASALPAHAR